MVRLILKIACEARNVLVHLLSLQVVKKYTGFLLYSRLHPDKYSNRKWLLTLVSCNGDSTWFFDADDPINTRQRLPMFDDCLANPRDIMLHVPGGYGVMMSVAAFNQACKKRSPDDDIDALSNADWEVLSDGHFAWLKSVKTRFNPNEFSHNGKLVQWMYTKKATYNMVPAAVKLLQPEPVNFECTRINFSSADKISERIFNEIAQAKNWRHGWSVSAWRDDGMLKLEKNKEDESTPMVPYRNFVSRCRVFEDPAVQE